MSASHYHGHCIIYFQICGCPSQSGLLNKLPLTGWLKKQTFISHSSECWEVHNHVASRSAGWCQLPDLTWQRKKAFASPLICGH